MVTLVNLKWKFKTIEKDQFRVVTLVSKVEGSVESGNSSKLEVEI